MKGIFSLLTGSGSDAALRKIDVRQRRKELKRAIEAAGDKIEREVDALRIEGDNLIKKLVLSKPGRDLSSDIDDIRKLSEIEEDIKAGEEALQSIKNKSRDFFEEAPSVWERLFSEDEEGEE